MKFLQSLTSVDNFWQIQTWTLSMAVNCWHCWTLLAFDADRQPLLTTVDDRLPARSWRHIDAIANRRQTQRRMGRWRPLSEVVWSRPTNGHVINVYMTSWYYLSPEIIFVCWKSWVSKTRREIKTKWNLADSDNSIYAKENGGAPSGSMDYEILPTFNEILRI